MARGRRIASTARRGGRGVLIGFIVGVVVAAGGGYAAWSLIDDGSPSDSLNTGSEVDARGATTSRDRTEEMPEDVANAVTACSKGIATAERAVSVAGPGVRHWNGHVQARTDMMAGRITVNQMKAIWKRTRLAGPGDQRTYGKARSDYSGAAKACAPLREVSGEPVAADCVDRAVITDRAVKAADAAMGDWQSHLDAMAKFAAGGMTVERSQQLWVQAWRTAPTNINAYNDGVAELDRAASCDAP